MRYKFKAWDKHNKKWYDRVLCGCDSDGLDYVCNLVWMDEIGDWTHFDEGCGTIVQWTGLKDRNGVEIYEGDIVFADSNEYNYVIKFGEYPNDHDDEYKCTGWYAELVGDGYKCSLQMTEGLEIIGNIYSTPHLLPKEEETT